MTTTSDAHADREATCPGCLGDGILIEHGEEGPCSVCYGFGKVFNPFAHADRETHRRSWTELPVEFDCGSLDNFYEIYHDRDAGEAIIRFHRDGCDTTVRYSLQMMHRLAQSCAAFTEKRTKEFWDRQRGTGVAGEGEG